jgi:hypothetical protein
MTSSKDKPKSFSVQHSSLFSTVLTFIYTRKHLLSFSLCMDARAHTHTHTYPEQRTESGYTTHTMNQEQKWGHLITVLKTAFPT